MDEKNEIERSYPHFDSSILQLPYLQERLTREHLVEEAREAREKLEQREAERRVALEREQMETLDHELEVPRHLSDEQEQEFFSEVSPNTADSQRHCECEMFPVLAISCFQVRFC